MSLPASPTLFTPWINTVNETFDSMQEQHGIRGFFRAIPNASQPDSGSIQRTVSSARASSSITSTSEKVNAGASASADTCLDPINPSGLDDELRFDELVTSVTAFPSKPRVRRNLNTRPHSIRTQPATSDTRINGSGSLAPIDLGGWSHYTSSSFKFYEPVTPITASLSISHVRFDPNSPTTRAPFSSNCRGIFPTYSGVDEDTIVLPLPDLPMDIFTHFLSLAPADILARLSATCTTLHALITPILYHSINLTYVAPIYPDPTKHYPESNPMYDHAISQCTMITTLLESPHLTIHMKSFTFTLGLGRSRGTDAELYALFNLLSSVEHLEIDDMPSQMYPAITEGLDNNVFPALRSVKLAGHMTYYMAEKIVVGGERMGLWSVELDVLLHDVPAEYQKGDGGVEHLVREVGRKSQGLERMVVGGKELVL